MPKILFQSEETDGAWGINFYDDNTYEVILWDTEKKNRGDWRPRFDKIEAHGRAAHDTWSSFGLHVQRAYHRYIAKLIID